MFTTPNYVVQENTPGYVEVCAISNTGSDEPYTITLVAQNSNPVDAEGIYEPVNGFKSTLPYNSWKGL